MAGGTAVGGASTIVGSALDSSRDVVAAASVVGAAAAGASATGSIGTYTGSRSSASSGAVAHPALSSAAQASRVPAASRARILMLIGLPCEGP